MIKKVIPVLSLLTACLTISYTSLAQDKAQYRRSSLSMVLIETESFPNKDKVMKSWNNYPFPDKYNEHLTDVKSVNLNSITLSNDDLFKAGFLKDTLKTMTDISKASLALKNLKFTNLESTNAVILPSEKKEYQLKLDKLIKSEKIANKMISTWFNRSSDGKFDMSLIQERGFYDASELETSIAKGQSRGLAALGDAGEELINNTFITFSKLEFVENEPYARKIRDNMTESVNLKFAGKPEALLKNALKAVNATYEKTKEGYSLWSKTWLYQLNWNDSTANIFYNDFWNNPTAFDNSDLFKLEFIGTQFNQSLVTFKLGEKRTEEEVINLTMVRNIDKAFAKLQKKNEVFKPKVPVLSSGPVTADIGMKEGLKGGEKFSVLEMSLNPKTGLTEYKVIGSVTVNKDFVWDNRYNANESHEPTLDEQGNPITSTHFKGGKKVQPGMLLKLIK